jgi:hypothetical protein
MSISWKPVSKTAVALGVASAALLRSDAAIADVVRFLGWAIMLGALVFLFSKRDRSAAKQTAVPDEGGWPRENISEPKNLDRRA